MIALLLVALIVALLVLRQPLLVILLAVAAYVQIVWGKAQLDYIIEDMWVGLDKEVILSIPLFILCGNVMTKGTTAKRLIRILSAITRPLPGGISWPNKCTLRAYQGAINIMYPNTRANNAAVFARPDPTLSTFLLLKMHRHQNTTPQTSQRMPSARVRCINPAINPSSRNFTVARCGCALASQISSASHRKIAPPIMVGRKVSGSVA